MNIKGTQQGMSADKNEIRSEMRARRKALTPEARAAAGRALSLRLLVTDGTS